MLAASEMTSCRFYQRHHHHDKKIIVPINAWPSRGASGFSLVFYWPALSCKQRTWKECTGNPPLPFIWEPDREILTRKLMRWLRSPVSLGLPGYLLLLQWGVTGIWAQITVILVVRVSQRGHPRNANDSKKGLPAHGDRGPGQSQLLLQGQEEGERGGARSTVWRNPESKVCSLDGNAERGNHVCSLTSLYNVCWGIFCLRWTVGAKDLS